MKTELCLTCLLVLFGLTNTVEFYKGCAKDGVIHFDFSCNNTMKTVFILNAYLTNQDCSSTLRYSEDMHFDEEFTREMKETCNTMTECRVYKNWKDKLEGQGDFHYYVAFSCAWLFPKTPVIEVYHGEKVNNKLGNQFVLQNRGYPYLSTASDFQCNISKHREDTRVTVQLEDFRNVSGIFCIKTSVSSGCVQSRRLNFLNFRNHDSFTVQGTIHSGDASPKTTFYLIIQASRSGSRHSDQPPDTKFVLSCRNAYFKETIDRTTTIQSDYPIESTANSHLTRENTNESSLGPIVGGAVSAVLLLVLVFSLGFFLGRRQLKARSTTSENNPPDELTAARRRSADNFEDAYETMDDGKTTDGYEMPTQRQNNNGYEIPTNRIDGPACDKVYTTLSSDKSKF